MINLKQTEVDPIGRIMYDVEIGDKPTVAWVISSITIEFDGCICETPLPEYLERAEVMCGTAKYWPRSRKYEVEISIGMDIEE